MCLCTACLQWTTRPLLSLKLSATSTCLGILCFSKWSFLCIRILVGESLFRLRWEHIIRHHTIVMLIIVALGLLFCGWVYYKIFYY